MKNDQITSIKEFCSNNNSDLSLKNCLSNRGDRKFEKQEDPNSN